MHAGTLAPVFLIAMLVALLVGTVVGAVLLRAAISLYNAMAGGNVSKRGVPEPSFGKAMGIVLITWIVNLFTSFGLGIVFGAGGAVAGVHARAATLLAQLIAAPVGLLIMAAMLTALLPTTFGRAVLVALCYLLIVMLLVVFMVFVAIGIRLAVGG